MSSAAPTPATPELEALLARLAALESLAQARDERIGLLEEENRWLKAQLFGRSSEKSSAEERSPDQTWLFSNTVKGAIASANLHSLVETDKANGAEPHAYLSAVFDRLLGARTVEDFEALLPWNLKASSSWRAG